MYGFIIVILVAVVFIIMGVLIWKKQRVNLIHSYHVDGVKDIKGYSSAMGKVTFVMGLFLLTYGVVNVIFTIPPGVSASVMLVGMVTILGIVFKIQKKYLGRYM